MVVARVKVSSITLDAMCHLRSVLSFRLLLRYSTDLEGKRHTINGEIWL